MCVTAFESCGSSPESDDDSDSNRSGLQYVCVRVCVRARSYLRV